MADYTAKWRIQGENGMQGAFRSMLGDAKSTSDRMGKMFRTAFAGISVASIGVGLARSAKEAITFADEMQKASLRTKLGASEFATLATAAKMADVELGTLSKGMRAMALNVSQARTGTKSAVEVFDALGINISEFSTLDARQQLEELADRLTALPDPADRARAGTILFKEAWEDLTPFMLNGAAGIREATDEIERMGATLTDAEIAKLAEADAAIKRLDASWSGFSRTLTAAASGPLTNVFDKMERLLSQEGSLTALAASWAAIAAGPPQTLPMRLGRELFSDSDEDEAIRTSTGSRLPPGGRNRRPTVPGFEADPEKPPKASKEAFLIASDSIAAWETAKQRASEYYNVVEFRGDVANDIQAASLAGLDAFTDSMEASYEQAAKENEEMSAFAEQAAYNMQDSFAQYLFDPFQDGMKGMVAGFSDTIRRMVAEAASAELLQAFFGWGAGLGGGIGSFFGSMSKGLPSRDSGGPGSAGSPVLIGTGAQPELYVPDQPGRFYPKGSYGMGGTSLNQTLNFNVSGGDAERFMSMMPGFARQIKESTLAAIRDMNGRGRL